MNKKPTKSNHPKSNHLGDFIALIKNDRKRFALIGIIISALGIGFLFASGLTPTSKMTAQKFVALQEGSAPHEGFRRAHAKGICITGEFVSSGLLAQYSKAAIFQEGSTPFYGRFSIGGGNPTAPDLKSPVRSLALAFSQNNGRQWRMAMNTPPVMAVRTPEDFYEQLAAIFPDPETGIRDPQKIVDFFKAHPESAAFVEWKNNYKPTNSFSTEIYNSINAFYLVDAQGAKQAVRWQAVPQAVPNYNIAPDAPSDALQKDMAELLSKGAVKFDLVFQFAAEEDAVADATQPWPDERRKITAGTIFIQGAQAQKGGICADTNFDPLVLPSGIEPSEDPILRARSAAYAESYRRRARETLLGAGQ
jgi:catalase